MSFNTMSLRESAQYDHKNDAKHRLTGWGKVCKDRQERGISRKARRRGNRNVVASEK